MLHFLKGSEHYYVISGAQQGTVQYVIVFAIIVREMIYFLKSAVEHQIQLKALYFIGELFLVNQKQCGGQFLCQSTPCLSQAGKSATT